jgi:hypothetical protein
MSKSLRLPAIAGLACLWATAAVADGPHGRPGDQRPPSGVIRVATGDEKLVLWPYTTEDFETPSDPVNLLFPNADPRAIRQALLAASTDRTGSPFAGMPFSNCGWSDGMGNEQAAYGWPGHWVGGEIQLVCVHANAPLGDPFRFHLRLFRIGRDTLGAAHFEVLIPGTAEHEALSWDFARGLVAYDLGATGAVVALPDPIQLIPAGTFRVVRRPIWQGLVDFGAPPGALIPLLAGLGLYPGPASGDVPIPTSGQALALVTEIDFTPAPAHRVTTTQVDYAVNVPKPFCATGPSDFVNLAGRLYFTMSATTLPSGLFERTHTIGGTLRVTPLGPGAGPVANASIFELHRAQLDDRHGQVTEQLQQSLLGDPFQSLRRSFAAGDTDRFVEKVVCGTE